MFQNYAVVRKRIQNTSVENRVKNAHFPEILITLSPKLLRIRTEKFPMAPILVAPGLFFEGPHQHSCGLFICECVVKSSSFYTPALYDGSWPGGACRTKCGCFWHHGSCLVLFVVRKSHHSDSWGGAFGLFFGFTRPPTKMAMANMPTPT